MLKLEKFDGSKTYMFPNGAIADPATIRNHFPAVDSFVHIIEVNGDVCQAVENLAAMRAIHNIDPALSEAAAIAALETIINTPAPVVISAEERLAAAAEFQNILALPDKDIKVASVDGDTTIPKQNYDKGLWSLPMLDVVVQKGVITVVQEDAIKTEKLTRKVK
jgi:hypothetical protein